MPEIFAGSASYPVSSPAPVLSIGNYDGLHQGHRHLLRHLVAQAHALGAPAAVYTFDPPPRVVLAPQLHQPRIQSWPDKVRIMGELGVDQVIVERFSRAFAQHPPEWFVSEVLGRRISPQACVLGYDFHFGRARAGDINTLRTLLPETPIEQVSALQIDGEIVSSSRIRRAVAEGEVQVATRLLGLPHRIRGTVVSGDQRGRTIGFPTANLHTDAQLLPSNGVYAVHASVDGGEWLPAVANLGERPTFDGRRYLIEVHLLDFSADLYGHELQVGFIERLRSEQRFDGPDALAAQIRLDVQAARSSLERSQ
jgi:riboflavin kinase/FMN adenylyltransferase